MPRLMIHELPRHPDRSEDQTVLRHWLTLDDGRIFYQDETITHLRVGRSPGAQPDTIGQRTEWHQLETPPLTARVVGLVDFGGEPMAVRSDGETFVIGRSISEADGQPCDTWLRAMPPVPCD